MNARFCSYCGAPLHPNARFCSQCGRAVQPAPVPPVPPPQVVMPPPTAAVAEPILNVVPALQKRKGLLGMGVQTFNLLLTPVRMVFVPVTPQEMRAAVNAAREQARGEGRGFLGQVAAQMAWVDILCQQYRSMPIDAVLAQHPGSFFILNAQVSRIRLRETAVDDNVQARQQVIVESVSGKHRFDLTGMSAGEARQNLRQVLPHAVR